mgnify:CR=1 FL=1|jgi:hypothetical protein
MHHLLVIAAFALAAVTPFMGAGVGPGPSAGYTDDADDAPQADAEQDAD